MSNKNNIKTVKKVTETVDVSSGEIISEKVQSVTWQTEPEYVKLYLEDLSKILGLKGNTSTVLLALIRKMNWDAEIVLTLDMKKELAMVLKLKLNTIEHNISDLVKEGLFIKKGINWYLVNPYYFGKGDWNSVKRIRLSISYDKTGRAFQKTEFDNQTQLDL